MPDPVEALAREIAVEAHTGQVDKAGERRERPECPDREPGHEGLCCGPAARRAGKSAADAALAAALARQKARKAREALEGGRDEKGITERRIGDSLPLAERSLV